ncbi:MAG TPA: peptide chain release factor N(5)-glutamine methyltransferase [Steroidobacteraceae bacterium]|nr:peptide chain release factor N(5)-glutamine methyltransferase [Steroidobacteraceae bacterium]
MDESVGGNLAEPVRVGALLAGAAALGVARLDAELLLAALLRVERATLLAFDERAVDALTVAMYEAGLERRAQGEPLAYITGVKEFWSLPLSVAPGVLVPRPETELLVELCLARRDHAPRRVADLGTGSGAIALALASERPQWRIIATDISADALQIAGINCRRLGIGGIELRQGRWCDALEPGSFDVVVSNPPYIAPDHPALAALRHEPPGALVAADEGYSDLLTIATQARARLQPGGLLLLEHGAAQAARLGAMLAALGYRDIACHQDLAGLDRVTLAIWP